MSLTSPILLLCLIWAAIHALHYMLKPRAQYLLPSPLNHGSNHGRSLWHTSTTRVIVKNLYLRVQTTAWNLHHDVLASKLSSSRRTYLRMSLQFFYNTGCVMGILGMIGAFGILLWTCGETGRSLVRRLMDDSGRQQGSSSRLMPRDAMSLSQINEINRQSSGSFLKPIVSPNLIPRVISQILCTYLPLHVLQCPLREPLVRILFVLLRFST
jgi:S2P endopeptidase